MPDSTARISIGDDTEGQSDHSVEAINSLSEFLHRYPRASAFECSQDDSNCAAVLPPPPSDYEHAPHIYALGWEVDKLKERLRMFYETKYGNPLSEDYTTEDIVINLSCLSGVRLFFYKVAQPHDEFVRGSPPAVGELGMPDPAGKDKETDTSTPPASSIDIIKIAIIAPDGFDLKKGPLPKSPPQRKYQWLCRILGEKPRWYADVLEAKEGIAYIGNWYTLPALPKSTS